TVNEHHGPCTVSAGIEPEARSFPKHAHVTGVSGIKRALAIAQAADKSAARAPNPYYVQLRTYHQKAAHLSARYVIRSKSGQDRFRFQTQIPAGRITGGNLLRPPE